MPNKQKLVVVVGVVLAGVAYWAWQWLGTATISVVSEPAGATVVVDRRERGTSPTAALEVDTGSHRVEVIHSWYAPHVTTLDLDRGDHAKLNVVLVPGEGTLRLLSNPKGAWVEVDGERIAERTPTRLKLASGPHTVTMGADERRGAAKPVELNHGQVLEVNVNLNLDPHGSVTIITSPRDATVTFVDTDIVYAPKVRVPIGEYVLRIARPGYVTEELRYVVRYGDNRKHVDLQRGYGALKVDAEPADAEVSVIYTEGGRRKTVPYQAGMQVPIGGVDVRARAPGMRTEHHNFRLTRQGHTLRVRLERIDVQVGATMVDRLLSGGTGPELVVIPHGHFSMGNPKGPVSEQPVRVVTITQPFAVTPTEVTVDQFLVFAQATGKAVDDRLDRAVGNAPMRYVSWQDAEDYGLWLSRETGERYRLPSEAEWEYMARGGTSTTYYFGDDPLQLCAHGNVSDRSTRQVYREWTTLSCDDGMVRPGPVATYQANPFGLFDVYGNVSEWVLECGIPEYEGAPTDGSATQEGRECESHGVRGGSWDASADEASSSYRNSASSANDDRGFRLVREL